MGFNTPILVLNDALHLIREDKDFGRKIADAATRTGTCGQPVDIGVSGHANAATVYATAHADVVQVMAFGGNHASTLTRIHNGGKHYTSEDQVKLLEDLVDQFGFRLVKKSAKRPGRRAGVIGGP